MRCRRTSTWRWSFLWNSLVFHLISTWISWLSCNVLNLGKIFHSNSIGSACDLRASRQLLFGFETHPGAITFPPEAESLWSHISTGPSASRNTFSVSTITDGNAWAAAPFLPLRWPDCTLSRLRAEEYDPPVTQSIATREPSSRTISTLDRTLAARLSLKCVATLGSRRSCPGWAAAYFTWMLTGFTSLTATETRLAVGQG